MWPQHCCVRAYLHGSYSLLTDCSLTQSHWNLCKEWFEYSLNWCSHWFAFLLLINSKGTAGQPCVHPRRANSTRYKTLSSLFLAHSQEIILVPPPLPPAGSRVINKGPIQSTSVGSTATKPCCNCLALPQGQKWSILEATKWSWWPKPSWNFSVTSETIISLCLRGLVCSLYSPQS